MDDPHLPDKPGEPPREEEALAPVVQPDWEIVLAKAVEERPEEPAVPAPPPDPRGIATAGWLRIAAPLVIIGGYALFKMMDAPASQRVLLVDAPATLSGVRAEREPLAMSRETERLVARLESLAARRDWFMVIQTIEAADPESARHPVVRAFEVVARVERGDRSAASYQQLRNLENAFRDSNRHGVLRSYLRLLQADVLLRTADNPEALLRNMDRLRQLVDDQPLTPRVLELRLSLARAYEQAGLEELKAAGTIRRDRVRLANARALFQQGLRWVVAPEGWKDLRPIDSGEANAIAGRLVLHLRVANARLHGPSMPFTGSDSETWTGRRGDPVHDHPGARW